MYNTTIVYQKKQKIMVFITKGSFMKSVLSILIATISLIYASSIPSKSYTTITSVNLNHVTLEEPIGVNGESALVVRTLATGEFATAYIMQTSKNKAVLVDNDPTNGKHLANIKPTLKVGDRVLGGFLYHKIMVIAPNKDSFKEIQNKFGIHSINPDLFLAFLKAKKHKYPNRTLYKKFAKLVGIGLFLIAKDDDVSIYDPISQKILKKTSFLNTGLSDIKPFYNTLVK
jgi:hypothetical protein